MNVFKQRVSGNPDVFNNKDEKYARRRKICTQQEALKLHVDLDIYRYLHNIASP